MVKPFFYLILLVSFSTILMAQKKVDAKLKQPKSPNIVPFKMQLIKGGSVILGNENTPAGRTLPTVTITDFYMATTEVTNRQYCHFLNVCTLIIDSLPVIKHPEKVQAWIDYGKGNSKIIKEGDTFVVIKGFEDYPVTRVSWEGATAFCAWQSFIINDYRLSEGLTEYPEYRLPSEAEWEYAAKTGLAEKYPIGKRAWIANNSNGMPHPVKQKKKNLSKIYDLEGNVAEWCASIYYEKRFSLDRDRFPIRKNQLTPEQPRVCKGGHFLNDQENVKPYQRKPYLGNSYYNEVGFRVVMTVLPSTPYIEF